MIWSALSFVFFLAAVRWHRRARACYLEAAQLLEGCLLIKNDADRTMDEARAIAREFVE